MTHTNDRMCARGEYRHVRQHASVELRPLHDHIQEAELREEQDA